MASHTTSPVHSATSHAVSEPTSAFFKCAAMLSCSIRPLLPGPDVAKPATQVQRDCMWWAWVLSDALSRRTLPSSSGQHLAGSDVRPCPKQERNKSRTGTGPAVDSQGSNISEPKTSTTHVAHLSAPQNRLSRTETRCI